MKKKKEAVIYNDLSEKDQEKCADFLGLVFVQSQLLFQTIENYSNILNSCFVPHTELHKSIYRLKVNTRLIQNIAKKDISESNEENLYDESSEIWINHIQPIVEYFQQARKKKK